MVKAEYKHPNFSVNQAERRILKDDADHSIVRLKYPDGVIVVFELTAEQVAVHSNYNYFYDTDTNTISPQLNSPNKDFKDFV